MVEIIYHHLYKQSSPSVSKFFPLHFFQNFLGNHSQVKITSLEMCKTHTHTHTRCLLSNCWMRSSHYGFSFGSMGLHTFPMFHVFICCSSKRSCSSLQTLSLSIKALQSAGWEKQIFTKGCLGYEEDTLTKNRGKKTPLCQHTQQLNFW